LIDSKVMSAFRLRPALAGSVAVSCVCAFAQSKAPDPRAVSVHPFAGKQGSSFAITVRGNGIAKATSVLQAPPVMSMIIEGVEVEPPNESNPRNRTPTDLVRLRVQAAAEVKPGRYHFRLVTPHGISNALAIHITPNSVEAEPAGLHETPETAVPVARVPALFTGRIFRRGESDFYAFDASAGETLTFEALSGLPSIGAPGGNANGFDPALTIWERSESWFDPKRLQRLAFNDEPLWVIGQLTNAHLVHTFRKSGRYYLRIEAFSGQGGPDYSYQLKILPGAVPPEKVAERESWEERSFTRALSGDRLNDLAVRGGKTRNQKSVETYRSASFQLPGTLEGTIAQPGEKHRASFHLDGPQDIAIEVETPGTAPPLFNPLVRLLNAEGEEVATSLFVGRGACSGAMSKSIQAKTIVPLRDPGDYTVEILEATADLAAPDFRYRIMIRPQMPHVGQVRIDEDHINITPGDARIVRVSFDREENFRGAVVVTAESLPVGIQALAGADFEPDNDPPLTKTKRERYTPRTERSVVVFSASADARATGQPHIAELAVRPIMDGKPGQVIYSKKIPIMVVSKQ